MTICAGQNGCDHGLGICGLARKPKDAVQHSGPCCVRGGCDGPDVDCDCWTPCACFPRPWRSDDA